MFEENIDLYKPYMDKIVFLKLDKLPFEGDSGDWTRWKNENYQKNYCEQGIRDLKPNDWILFSDVDEIPNKDCIKSLASLTSSAKGVARYYQFRQKLFYYYVNVLQAQIWGGTVAMQRKNFRSMMDMRNNREHSTLAHSFPNGGWHYSYCGGPDRVFEKMRSYAEWKQNEKWCTLDNIQASIKSNVDLLGRTDAKFNKKRIDISNDPSLAPSNIQTIINKFPYLLRSD
jgi:beta-1,4-mannosyl-glycoprotein beta-1,4-N-acetylglucosaminyltransferase